MKKVIYRDEPFFYRIESRGDSIWYDKRQVVLVFRKREDGFLALFRPYVKLGEGVVGSATIPATLKRVLKSVTAKETRETPLLIECSPEIEDLYRS